RVAGLADVLARRAAVVRSRADRHGALGGEDDARPPPGQRLAADLLRGPEAVGVGGVDEVPAGVEEAVDQRLRLALATAPAGHAEGHRAEAELGHAEAAAAERPDAHVLLV